MKMTEQDFNTLRDAIAPRDTPANRKRYRAGDFPRSLYVKDLDKRYRWDLLYASRALTGDMCAQYNDSHVDTALRAIVQPLDSDR